MLPSLSLLEPRLVDRILAEAFALISERGVTVQAQAAVELLSAAGASVENGIAHIPEPLARHPSRQFRASFPSSTVAASRP